MGFGIESLYGTGLTDAMHPDNQDSGGFLYDVFDPFDVTGVRAGNSLDRQNALMAGQRARAKANQLAMLGQLQGPQTTPAMENRIKALETESTRPMLEDPNYGLQVGQATRGGAQALSSIQNKQRATGTTGGFQNVGSMSDVYDRVGGQLSQIAAVNQQAKEQKAQKAAELRQTIADGQIAFQNSIQQARMAIESGDAASTQAALQAAYNAKAQIENSTKQMVFGLVGTVGGAFLGSPQAGAAAGKAAAGQPTFDTSPINGYNQGQGPTMQNYNNQLSGMNLGTGGGGSEYKPYYAMGNR